MQCPDLEAAVDAALEQGAASLACGCKINLFLEIKDTLPDGYHSLKTYMLPLAEPHDELEIHLAPGRPRCLVFCSTPGLSLTDNTLTKAYAHFQAKVPAIPALRIKLHKGVPQGAGLGGGSANAATLLLFLNKYTQKKGVGLPLEELLHTAAQVGADVSFFILNTPAWAEGKGEILRPNQDFLPYLTGKGLLLLCPDLPVSTAWAYAAWDQLQKRGINALTKKTRQYSNNGVVAPSLRNDLEEAVFPAYPQVAALKTELYAAGAEVALMSGSGSCVFGIFSSVYAADSVGKGFEKRGLRVYSGNMPAGASPSW